MKKLTFLNLTILICLTLNLNELASQVISKRLYSNDLLNRSLKRASIKSIAKTIGYVGNKEIEDLLKEDSLESNAGLPYRFGKSISTSINLVKQGTLSKQGDTTVIHYLISSKGAKSINLIFDKFKLDTTSILNIYNSQQNYNYGPVTYKINPKNGIFWTDLIPGDSIILEVKTLNIKENELHIANFVHGYKNTFIGGFGQSDTCNRDIACIEDVNIKNSGSSVALLLLANGDRFCSGALINSTPQDFRPYFLTAFHCLDNNYSGDLSPSERSQVSNWLYRFKYESPTCGGSDGINYITFNGSSFVSAFQPTDFALLELNNRPTPDQNISYAGWSRSSTPATSSYSIHHPRGDVKKISIDVNPLNNLNFETEWDNGLICPANTHWQAVFETGTVQPASSGAPIFDQNHRIVGQLHGDHLNDGLYCVNRRGEYGRFDASWNGGGTNATRLSTWLDPCNSGIETVNTVRMPYLYGPSNICSYGSTFSIQNLPPNSTVFWDKSSNMQISNSSGNWATFVPLENGNGWIQPIITSTCPNIHLTFPKTYFWVGMPNYAFHITRPDGWPVATDQYGNTAFCPNTTYNIWLYTQYENHCYSYDESWTIPSDWTINYINGSNISITTSSDPYNFIAVDAKSCCGEDFNVSQYFEYGYDCGYSSNYTLMFSPNPASEVTSLTIVDKTGKKLDENLKWTLEVHDFMQKLKAKEQNLKGSEAKINTSGWMEGVYIVSVKMNNEVVKGKLIIKK